MKSIFQSENICFVEVSEELINDYLTMINDQENVTKYISSRKELLTMEDEIKWVRGKLDEKAAVFSMIEKKSGCFIGNIELMDKDDKVRELGISITAVMQNKGFGKEAIRAVSEYAKKNFKLAQIVLRVHPDNGRAIHVYKECGFCEYDRTDDDIFMRKTL